PRALPPRQAAGGIVGWREVEARPPPAGAQDRRRITSLWPRSVWMGGPRMSWPAPFVLLERRLLGIVHRPQRHLRGTSRRCLGVRDVCLWLAGRAKMAFARLRTGRGARRAARS